MSTPLNGAAPRDQAGGAGAGASHITVMDRFASGMMRDPHIRSMSLDDALAATWNYDAHIVAYEPRTAVTPNGERTTLRLLLEQKDADPEKGLPARPAVYDILHLLDVPDVRIVVLIGDVDAPGHVATPEWRTETEARLVASGLQWYATKGGYRVLEDVDFRIRTRADYAEWRTLYLGWAAYLAKTYGLQIDQACADWTRLYRLPNVVRDRVPTTAIVHGKRPTFDRELHCRQPSSIDSTRETDEEIGRRLARTMPAQTPDSTATGIRFARALAWGLGLDRETATKIWLEIYNPRCQPQWSQREINHKLDDASKPEGSTYPFGALRHGGDPSAHLELITDYDSANAALDNLGWLISCLRNEGTRARVRKHLDQYLKDKRAIDRAFKKAKEAADAAKAVTNAKSSPRDPTHPNMLQSRRDAGNILLWESDDRGFQPVALGALRLRIQELGLPIALGYMKDEKSVDYTAEQIVEREARTFGESMYDFALRTSCYEPDHDRVVVGYPICAVTAAYDADVDEWLQAIGGPHYSRLKQWIASCDQKHIRRLAATLVILGRPDVGKSLLAKSVAGLWGVAEPAKGDLLVARFNGDLTRCPIVLDDEAELFGSKKLSTKRFRELAQSVERSVERKGRERETLRGAMRLIVAGNGIEDINFTDVSGPEVVSAVNDRLLVIDTKGRDEKCKEALARLRLPGSYVCDRERITRHMAWLGENVLLLEERFVGAVAGAQAVLSGHARNYPDVWASLAAWLDPKVKGSWPWRIHGDALLVDPNGYFAGTRGQVDRKDVHAALMPFKTGEQRPRVKNPQDAEETRPRMWALDVAALIDAVGLDSDDIDELVKRLEAAAKAEHEAAVKAAEAKPPPSRHGHPADEARP